MSFVRISRAAAAAMALAGCSLIYNPNNLPVPPVDAAPDAFIVDPTALSLAGVGPRDLYEGQGTGGSRQAILAITGINIAPDAQVTLIPADGQSPAPMIELDHEHAKRAPNVLAVPVTLPVDPGRGLGDVPLKVQVTQTGPEGAVTRTLDDVTVVLHNLPELEAPITEAPALGSGFYTHSRVNVPAGLTFSARAGAPPVVIRSASSIELGDVHVDAAGQTPGPGGFAGGAKNQNGSGPGGGKSGGLGGLLTAGSGGGFGEAGTAAASTTGGLQTGDELLVSFASNAGSGGGGGGNKPGGGAGGTIELTARGTLTTGTITANGAAGGQGTLGLFGAAGGGSGGAILLRSGGAAKLGAIKADGGPGGTGGPAGGAGGRGRLRYDVPSFEGDPPATPGPHRRGVAFVGDLPLITGDARQTFPAVSDRAPNVTFQVFVFDAANVNTDMTALTFPTESVPVRPELTIGYNRVCIVPPGGNPTNAESTNCIDIAYVP